MKPHNVFGQCFLNILVLSCDLEPIGFEEGLRKRVSRRERAARRTVQSPTKAAHHEKQLKHTRIHLDTRAAAHSEYSEAKQLHARAPVDTK